jgi:hypothetical protein
MNLVQSVWEARRYDRVRHLLEQQRPKAGESDLRGWEWHYWRRRLARGQLSSVKVPALARLADGLANAPRFAFTSDGAQLVAILKPAADSPEAAHSYKLAVIDAATGREQSEFDLQPEPGTNEIPLLSISNDGTRIVHACTGADRWQTVIRDGRSGKKIATLAPLKITNPMAGLTAQFAISPDGTLVAEAHMGRRIGRSAEDARMLHEWEATVFDAATGKQVISLPTQHATTVHLLWSSDGKQLLRRGMISPPEGDNKFGYEFQLFDARSGEQLWSRADESQTAAIAAIHLHAWSPDRKLIAVERFVSDVQAAIELWDAATGKTLATLARPAGETYPFLRNLVFSLDSHMLALGDHETYQQIHVWGSCEESAILAATQLLRNDDAAMASANRQPPLMKGCEITNIIRQNRATISSGERELLFVAGSIQAHLLSRYHIKAALHEIISQTRDHVTIEVESCE